ncbi:MAG: site-2 protease family protein [Actinomycetota bacterium]|nr:site-2 protease family protein [Actinomycetota bacterium]
MATGGSIQLARLFGIRVGASPSWFIVLFVMVYALSGYFRDVLGGSDGQAYVVAVGAAALFFLSILLHVFGHALVARRNGIEVQGVDLWFFGGVAKLGRDTDSPGEEFRISAAGPAVTALIVLLATVAAILVSSPDETLDAARFSDAATSPTLALLSWLSTINLFLLVFNLVPAFPLDGGRIARAIAWRVTGDKNRGTRIAGRMGTAFSYVLIGLGAYLAFTTDPFNGIWFMVLGFFLGQGAKAAVVGADFSESIEGVTAEALMGTHPSTVDAATPTWEALAELERMDWAWSAVVAADGRFLGILDASSDANAATAGDAVPAADRDEFAVLASTELEQLVRSPKLRSLGALVVVDDDGRLVGVVSAEQVQRALSAAATETATAH